MKKPTLLTLLTLMILPLGACGGSKVCTITFDPNNGEPTFSIQVNKGDFIDQSVVEEEPFKKGYDFVHWTYNKIKWSFKYDKVQGDMTLLAKYKVIEYKVDYDLTMYNDYTVTPRNPYRYTIEDNIVLENPSMDMLDFTGWVDEDGNKVEVLGNGNIGDLYLTPTWTRTNRYMYFGSRPFYLVTDEELMATLDNITPIDNVVSYNGDRYYCHAYVNTRNNQVSFRSLGKYVFVPANTTMNLYFKYEPIPWNIISEDDESYTLISHITMDGQSFVGGKNRVWKDYNLRTYLNGEFLDKYFTTEEQDRILVTEVDNSPASYGTCGSSFISCENTFDKVYLPSIAEVETHNTAYYSRYTCDYDNIVNGVSNYPSLTALRSPMINPDRSTELFNTMFWYSDSSIHSWLYYFDREYRPVLRLAK